MARRAIPGPLSKLKGGLSPLRPLSGLQEIRVSTREDSGVLCFHSRRGVTHRVATPWTAAYQGPPSMGFSRQEYWTLQYTGMENSMGSPSWTRLSDFHWHQQTSPCTPYSGIPIPVPMVLGWPPRCTSGSASRLTYGPSWLHTEHFLEQVLHPAREPTFSGLLGTGLVRLSFLGCGEADEPRAPG